MKATSVINKDTTWDAVLERLKEQTSPNSFNAWLVDVAPLKFEDDGRTLVLSIPNELTRMWIKRNMETHILSEVMKFNPSIKGIKMVISRNPMRKKPSKKQSNLGDQNVPLGLQPIDRATGLNTDMTFDNFVVVGYNRFAFTAAESIMEKPGFLYNPFYIYGPTGVGKTHLLQAIGNKMQSLNPSLRIHYTTTENFKEGFITAVKRGSVDEFRKTYQSYQLLILDDVHFLQKSESVVVEMFHLFNAMLNKNSQIILSSDKPPAELDKIEDRIKTRLNSGIVIDIESPSVEDMAAVCKERANTLGINLTPEALNYIVENVSPNIREIHGALNSVHLHISNKPSQMVDYSDVKNYIRNYIRKRVNIAHSDVVNVVCEFYNLDPGIMPTKSRKKEVVHARHLIMFILREYLGASYSLIGKEFGNRDHTTVIHSYEKINRALQEDVILQKDLDVLKKKMGL